MTKDSEPTEEEVFEIARRDFNEVADFSLRVSIALNGEPTTLMGELASIVQARMCANAASVEHQFSAPLIDQSAIMSLCRMIMESMILYFYLTEEISEDECECRYKLMHLHDTVNRIKLMRGFQRESQYPELLQGRALLESQIRGNPYFKGLKPEQQARLLTGEHFYIEGVRKAVERSAGWNPRVYFAYYSYFSAHAHSAPMSFFRFKQKNSDFLTASSAQRSGVATALCFAEFSLLRTSLAFLSSSPKAMASFSQDVLLRYAREVQEQIDMFNSSAECADAFSD